MEVETATTTEEALRSLDADKFHLIITDMHRIEDGVKKPHAGLELLRKIGPKYRNALVFYTSNASLWRSNAEISECGAVATDTASDLFSEVKKIMRRRESERGMRRFIPGQRPTPRNSRS
jgi:DNA-binding NtrC family response regulator